MLDALFATLWRDYSAITPLAEALHDGLEARGESWVNDHVAVRTFDLEGIDIEAIAAPFIEAGYVRIDDYVFAQKKLRATAYRHPDGGHPRVFVSELMTEAFSAPLQAIARRCADGAAGLTGFALLTRRPTWPAITSTEYDSLLAESEYAAWTAAFGLRANHFTVSVHELETFGEDPMGAVGDWVREMGYAMNLSGGEIKGSVAQGLEQSSTLADAVEVQFSDAARRVPSCYAEFAIRHEDPASGALFEGFITSSADKIFESTDAR